MGSKMTAALKILLPLSVALSLQQAHGQFDDLSDNFNAPPPPPMDDGSAAPPSVPTSRRGAPVATPTSNGDSGSDAKDNSILNRGQKNKFAKAGIEDINNENFPETIESFDYPNADITDVVKAISELTGKNFIIDPGVRGKITILAPSKITVAEAYKAFLSALAINGYAVVPSGSFLKIRSARNAQRDGIDTYAGNYYPNSDQMITRIIHLKYINVDIVNRDLRILTSKDGELAPYPQTNSLIISDYGSNIERIMKIITQLDVPGFEDQLEVIPIKFAKAKDIAELVSKIVNKGETNQNNRGGAFSAGVPRFSRPATSQGGSGSAYFMVIPDERSNSLVVTGNKAGIARIKKLLNQLDFRIRPEDAGGVYVYYIKNGDAEKIAQTLSGVAKDAGPKPSGGGGPGGSPMISPFGGIQPAQQEIFGGDVKITADKGTNSLVIVASKQDYEIILNLLNKIDIPRDQVFVEAVIMEMKSGDVLNWQVGYFQYDKSGSGAKSGFNTFKSDELQSFLSPAGGTGAILGFGSGDPVTIKPLNGTGTATTIPSLLGFFNFLKTNTNANILSTPQLLAMDNQEAEIEVGDKVVTGVNTTTSATAGGTQSSPIFEDATIKLKIKPFISPAANTVRMELQAQVKQLSTANTPKGLQDTTQPLATRSIKTNIVVPNRDTAVLGGLMKEDDIETVNKVPLLGDIPVIGWLFKSRNAGKAKTNLLIFLTPSIIRGQDDSHKVLARKLDQRLKYIKSMGGRDPYGETVDEITATASSAGKEPAPAPSAKVEKK